MQEVVDQYGFNEQRMLQGILAWKKKQRSLVATTQRRAERAVQRVKRSFEADVERILAEADDALICVTRSLDPKTKLRSLEKNNRELRRIVDLVAKEFGLSACDVMEPSHSRRSVMPRQIAMLLMRETTVQKYTEIARFFAKHHTTIIYSANIASAALAKDPTLKQRFDRLCTEARRLAEVAA